MEGKSGEPNYGFKAQNLPSNTVTDVDVFIHSIIALVGGL